MYEIYFTTAIPQAENIAGRPAAAAVSAVCGGSHRLAGSISSAILPAMIDM